MSSGPDFEIPRIILMAVGTSFKCVIFFLGKSVHFVADFPIFGF